MQRCLCLGEARTFLQLDGATVKKFLIPSLVAAGFFAPHSAKATVPNAPSNDHDGLAKFAQRLALQHEFILASHSSHSSHASHASHRSSAGGGYSSYPTPSYTAPAPTPAPPKILPGNSAKFTRIVRQVQTALMSYGYYSGAIDGMIGPLCKSALKRFQSDYGLKATGTITPEVLDAFGISAR